MNTAQQILFDKENLLNILEPLIRKIIREELTNFVQQQHPIFFLNPDMPIYDEMKEISERKKEDAIQITSHDEVWHAKQERCRVINEIHTSRKSLSWGLFRLEISF
ncbi:MAG: hypothetical protein HQK65_20380 [Desulfamplus sp.]|nr:hypothetical protein [Desulfamplus sp.]